MNYSNLKTLGLFCIILLISLSLSAQKAPMKYGKVSKEDLEMKVYPSDTSAAAAILCNYGYFSSTQFQFVQTIRVKIFKKEGVIWGDRVFPTASKSNIRGITFNLENGQVVESKLKSESIFRERITENYYRVRVAMPNVKEGSVIDLEIVYSWLPSEWRFQEEIPVRWSELIIEPSQYIDFRTNFVGFEPLSERSDMRWVAKDMPAFKKEPYMNDISNYITKCDIEVRSIVIPEVINYYASSSWGAVNGNLRSDEHFGGVLEGSMYLHSTAKEIETKYTDPLDKLKAAYQAIKKVKWNETKSLYSSNTSLGSVLNKKIGNSADINLMLIQLLKKLDFEAYPVALSTRDNGLLPFMTPTLDKFNYVIACVNSGGKSYLLDATEEWLPVGLLPERCLNFRGRIIDDSKSEWIDLKTDKKAKRVIQYDLKLSTDNLLSGKMTCTRADYSAFNFRKAYEKFNSQDEYLKDFESDNKGLTVTNCTITNLNDIDQPVTAEYEVKIKDKINNAGNMLYLNPMMYEKTDENPFKLEERKFPVDFIYPMETVYLFKLALPEGYQVAEMPKPLIIKLPDNSASCMYQIVAVNNLLQLTYKFSINKAIFNEQEYANLREFFSQMIKKQAEPVILKTNL